MTIFRVDGNVLIGTSSPTWGKVLMSTDTNGTASWVSTSSLGIVGGGGTALPTYTDGQTLQMVSGAWACVSTVSPGSGLVVGGGVEYSTSGDSWQEESCIAWGGAVCTTYPGSTRFVPPLICPVNSTKIMTGDFLEAAGTGYPDFTRYYICITN